MGPPSLQPRRGQSKAGSTKLIPPRSERITGLRLIRGILYDRGNHVWHDKGSDEVTQFARHATMYVNI